MNNTSIVKIIILSSSTILLLYISFPPVDFGYCAWIALVPWFILLLTEKRHVFLCTFILGFVLFFFLVSWLRYVTYISWFLLGCYCSAYFLCFAVCTRYIIVKLKLPFTVVAPCVWTALEYMRSFLLSGFPWFFVGHTQYRFLPVIQLSDITGVYGITFVIVMANAGIAECVIQILHGRNYIKRLFSYPFRKITYFIVTAVLPCILLITMLLYGNYKLKNYSEKDGPKICLVQGNIPQDLKFDPTEEDQINILKKYSALSMNGKGQKIDLLVWPETMIPGLLNISPDLTGRKIDMLSQLTAVQLAQDLNSHVLFGALALEIIEDEQKYYNSAFYYNKKGILLDRYDKIHLVPFGEYTPLKSYFPFLANLVPYEIGLTHGQQRTLFKMDFSDNKGMKFGASICYEDTVPTLMRKFKKDGADFMLNMTNDGWFHDSAELDQHLAIMVFRSVENRITMARAANTGISSFVSPNGKIYDTLIDKHGKYKEVSGSLINHVKLVNESNTFYTVRGDWFAIVCVTASGVMLFFAFIKRLYA